MTLPCYTYSCMVYCYMTNCVLVILKEVSSDKKGNPKKKKLRLAVFISTILLILSFIAVYVTYISM
jgi:DNA polymerase sigma